MHVNFSRPGFWTLIAETTTQSRLIGTTYIQVKAKGHADTKIPGDTAIPSVDTSDTLPRAGFSRYPEVWIQGRQKTRTGP